MIHNYAIAIGKCVDKITDPWQILQHLLWNRREDGHLSIGHLHQPLAPAFLRWAMRSLVDLDLDETDLGGTLVPWSRCSGFLSHVGTPIAGWFLVKNHEKSH